MVRPFTKLRGGISKAGVDRTSLITFLIIILLVHIALASLMWGDIIQFSSNDSKLATAITISVAGTIVLVYLLYIVTESESTSELKDLVAWLFTYVQSNPQQFDEPPGMPS